MSVAELVKNFDRAAGDASAIPPLRRFILDLAVRGKLVGQDPNEEPASQLIERIKAQKASTHSPRTKNTTNKPSVADDELPYRLPANWQWSHLAEIGYIGPRNVADDQLQASFITMPMIPAEYGAAYKHDLRPWAEIKRGYTHFANDDVALAKITPCFENGKSTVFRELQGGLGAGTTELHVVRPVLVSGDYVLIFLKSPQFIEGGIPRMTGTAGQKRVPADYFAHSPFPLPPLDEQHRIVARVDELMSMCDRLETAQSERERRRDLVANASLHRMDAATDLDPSALREDVEFHLENLQRLTVRPSQVRALRRTLLGLAVRGRLGTQDDSDEPASELLRQIEVQRAVALDCGYPNKNESVTQKRKQLKQSLPEALDDLPSGWTWATLMQCSELVVDCHNKTAPYVNEGIPLVRTTNVRDGKLILNGMKFVDEQTYARWSARCNPEPGDILITREAPLGEVCQIPAGMRICLGQRMMLARLVPDTVDVQFLLYSLRDPRLLERVQDKPVGATVEHLRVGGVETLLIPVPPLAEQRRIVATLDQLMALCDRLEAQLAIAQVESSRLLQALLHEALASAA